MQACAKTHAAQESGRDNEKAPVQRVGGATMGTQWSLNWVEDSATIAAELLQNKLEHELENINALMSTWDPTSELSRFNASTSLEPVALHAQTLEVIDAALSVSRLTKGRYDITLQPVIDLWGFNSNVPTQTPDNKAIQDALASSGYQKLVRVKNTVRKRQPQVSVDVSSLAKGYAVDRLGEVAESLGVSRYVVDIGGEVRARGERDAGLYWRVGVETPEGQVGQIISLDNQSIATSGSYRNYRMQDGQRLSHIIDGATGRPVMHSVIAVSVVHQSTMLADAWATALLVVGELPAIELIEQQALTAQITLVKNGKFQLWSSAGFKQMLVG